MNNALGLTGEPAGTPALSQALWPQTRVRTLAMDALLALLGSLLVAALAQVALPLTFTPVPLTGQTLGVLLAGVVLGWRRAGLAMCLYLLEGAVGLPVFAGWGAGWGKFVGPTGGYLLAFPLAAMLTGWLAERGWDRQPLTAALAMFSGSLVILGLGTLGLALTVGGLIPAFFKGFLPFLPGDLIKTSLAAILLPGIWKAQRDGNGSDRASR